MTGDSEPPRPPGLAEDDAAERARLYARHRGALDGHPRTAPRTDGTVWLIRIGVVTVVLAVLGLRWWAAHPVPRRVDRRPIDVASDPVQDAVAGAKPIFWKHQSDHVTIYPLASYRIAARVVGTSRYRFGWQGSLVPWDVALVWGRVADPDVLALVHFLQSDRWVHYMYSATLPVDADYLVTHISNNHWIPATENVRRAIAHLSTGDRVDAQGYLVHAEHDGGGDWTSSLVRNDTGDGSCELMYVRSLRVGASVYE